MTFLERINSVLYGKKPDKVPFAPKAGLIPRGRFEREMRNKGMGLYSESPVCWHEMPDVKTEYETQKDTRLTVYNTPVGKISSGRKNNKIRRMIENVKDYEPVIFMIEDTIFHPDYSVYLNTVRDLGSDGLVRASGILNPLEEAAGFIGVGNLEKELERHPQELKRLIEALEHRTERLLEVIINSPAIFVSVGFISNYYSPELLKKYVLPFYHEYIPQLREEDKICALDINTSRISGIKEMISKIGVDVLQGFTPPPEGDLSIKEALEIDSVIWLNLPDCILFDDSFSLREYIKELIRQDKSGNSLILGLTNLRNIDSIEMEETYKNALMTIIDVVG
ncbi:hypothetical protein GF312_00835 [Candidatus Poribacteria bacterium]|nr:hypothetical protein [Candidatus Poribacteria bacterium]